MCCNTCRALSLFVLLPLVVLLLLCVLTLTPLQHLEPIIVHHYENGLVSVTAERNKKLVINAGQIESDLVRYVINRESYSPAAYPTQYSLTNLLSDSGISAQYRRIQSSNNKNAPINLLGKRILRTVHIESVLFLNNASDSLSKKEQLGSQHNLAQVSFSIIDRNKATGAKQKTPLIVLISWRYRGRPKNPNEAWRNWSGFTVTHYDVQQRNV